ncbi:hypothetical protein [Nocardioides marmoribigeumensis]|uniref:Uncharacterized protein n=1 Tax=Nocardioides marmoribigeumensis TaxID=433649 RepID=A0ABU2BWQ9_9ACTN|nr:hypothetical protein [Nocardioides marmoribigeumensis]MDR7362443.1 hypothetical protein [Nocardioides marmoribigeumensis]
MTDLDELLREQLRAAADEGPAFVAPDLTGEPPATHRRRWPAVLAAAAVLAVGGVGYTVLREPEQVGSADCGYVVRWDGRRWTGIGIDRSPVAGDTLGQGAVLGCDEGRGRIPDEPVVVRSVRGVDAREAILVGGEVLLPEGSTTLPGALRGAREPVRCDLEGTARLAGRWTGATGPRKVRFDGDLRPPYRIDFVTSDQRVTDGWASVVLHARATATSRPLRPAEVKAMLWHEGEEVLTAHCVDGRFVADSIDPGS